MRAISSVALGAATTDDHHHASVPRAGLALRYDDGPCFRSDHYQAEIDHFAIARSPAFH